MEKILILSLVLCSVALAAGVILEITVPEEFIPRDPNETDSNLPEEAIQ